MRVDPFHAFQAVLPEVEPAGSAGGALQRLRVIRHAHDVLGHQAEDRRMQPRMREALDLVDVVVGDELARAGRQLIGAFQRADFP
jgi:hypothetical protein